MTWTSGELDPALLANEPSIVDLLVMPETTPVEFEPERAVITPRPVDF